MSLQNNNLDIGPNAGEDKLRRLFYYESILASGAVVPELDNLVNEDVEKIYWRLVNEGIIKLNVTEDNLPARLSVTTLDTRFNDKLDKNTGTIPDARLRTSLRETATTITDWNNAEFNGWYMGSGAANAPEATGWFIGTVERHNALWITQTVHGFTADGSTDTKSYRRSANDSGGTKVWTAWYRLRLSEAEQTALYATKTELATKANDDGLFKGTLGRKFRVIAGTIRNTGTGWAVLDDTGHRATGVTGVTVTATTINIAFASTLKVVSFVCGPDETYASRGLRVGASVALDSANISCYQENEHRISDYVTWDGTAWSSLEGVFSGFSFANSALSMSHVAMGTTRLYANANARPPANAAANVVASIGSLGDTTTAVELRTPAGGVITTLPNPTRLWVERTGLRKAVTVDPATLTETSGNIWFIGVVED